VSENHSKMETTTLIIECPYDANLITVYVKHQSKLNPTKNLKQDDVVLIQNVYRKITSNIDIICQIFMRNKDDLNMQVIGRIDRHAYSFTEQLCKTMSISDIPSSAIIRNKIAIDVSIVDIHMIRIKYVCDICGNAIEANKKCAKGCNVTIPKLCIDVLCAIEDGTERASLKILDQQAISAFNIPQDRLDYFKQFCQTYGNFFHPCNDIANQHMYNEILQVFKQWFTFTTISMMVVPFCKINYDKNGMNEMVSRPNYVLSDADKSMGVYLNGEITRKRSGNKNKTLRKVKCSFKAIEIKESKLDDFDPDA